MFSGFLRSECGAVTVDWVVLTGAMVGLGLATIAVVSTGAESASNEIAGEVGSGNVIQTAFADDPFDLSSYTYLSPSQGFVSWQNSTLPNLTQPSDYYYWLDSDAQNAMQPANGTQRAMFADDYAVTYAQAQDQGIDLSGYADPNDLSAQVAADLGL